MIDCPGPDKCLALFKDGGEIMLGVMKELVDLQTRIRDLGREIKEIEARAREEHPWRA